MRRLTGTAICRHETCRASITFASNTTTGKQIPLDLDPVANGNVTVTRTRPLIATVLGGEQLVIAQAHGQELYVSHFATCPAAKSFRRDKGAK